VVNNGRSVLRQVNRLTAALFPPRLALRRPPWRRRPRPPRPRRGSRCRTR
jgi:hypothetical protein